MKRILIFCTVCLMISFVMSTMVSCRSCGDKRVDDISKVPGIYKGQAELLIPDNLKKMIKPDSTGKSPIPDGPVPCKLEIKENENKELTIEIVDFKMPNGMEMAPSSCRVSQDGEVFNLEGEGKVSLGTRALPYEHAGKIEGTAIHLDGTVYIIPKVFGVKIVFDGEKN